MFWYILLTCGIIAIDQFSKIHFIAAFIKDASDRTVGPFLNLVNAWNPGVSFSMLDSGGLWGTIILSLFAFIVILFLSKWMYEEKNSVIRFALALIIGGAIGNLIDRIQYGAVFDFLDFHYETWHWPTFNLADVFICIGAFLIIVYSLCTHKKSLSKEIVK